MKYLGDHIYVLKDAMPLDICKKIIEKFEEDDRKEAAMVVGDATREDKAVVKTNMRNCQSLMPLQYDDWMELNQYMVAAFQKGIDELIKANKWAGMVPMHDCGYQILSYGPGEMYSEHIDEIYYDRRELTGIIYLNTMSMFGGGETRFCDPLYQTVRPKEGSMLMFPSFWTHPHESLPVIKGKKYVIVTWFTMDKKPS